MVRLLFHLGFNCFKKARVFGLLSYELMMVVLVALFNKKSDRPDTLNWKILEAHNRSNIIANFNDGFYTCLISNIFGSLK